jgi:hypothetical protein
MLIVQGSFIVILSMHVYNMHKFTPSIFISYPPFFIFIVFSGLHYAIFIYMYFDPIHYPLLSPSPLSLVSPQTGFLLQ